jgi:hypothetical protein
LWRRTLRTQRARQDTRAGSYDRTLQTRAGEVNLKLSKLRRQTFETTIIERYRRRESFGRGSADRDVSGGDFSAAGEGHHRSPLGYAGEPEHGVEPQKKIYAKIEAWRNRRIEGEQAPKLEPRIMRYAMTRRSSARGLGEHPTEKNSDRGAMLQPTSLQGAQIGRTIL